LFSFRGGKLSKRHDDASVKSFMAAGFLPEAMINFVVAFSLLFFDG
jgi:glutamyl/glutaminyl-tRNA synthetase